MAASNKTGRNSGRQNTRESGRKTNNRKAAEQREDALDNKLLQEIVLILVFALCAFLFLCNFGIMGSFGDILSHMEFGLFGLPAYIAPLLFFFALAFGMSNRGISAAKRKLIAGITLYVLVSMLCELLSGRLSSMESYSMKVLYQGAWEHHNGGGVLAGSLAYLLHHYLDTLGTVLVIVVLALICIVLLTEKSVLKGAKDSGRFLAEGARRLESSRYENEEDADYIEETPLERRARLRAERQERNELRQREQEERANARRIRKQEEQEEKEDEKILRMNRKSRGVMLDTSLSEKEPGSKHRDEMHEITIRDMEEEFRAEPEIRPVRRKEAEVDEVQEISYEPSDTAYQTEPERSYGEEKIYAGRSYEDFERDSMPEPVTEFSPRKRLSESDKSEENNFRTGAGEVPAGKTGRTVPERKAAPAKKYVFPPVTLLRKGKNTGKGDSNKDLKDTALRLQQTLETFGVKVTVTEISQGPSVTRFELQPEQGVKVSKIVGLADDIKLNLAATDIRIEAPIPGKAAVGIEVPNKENSMVAFRDLIESREYQSFSSKIAFAVGKDIAGQVVVTDIAKMPHMLIAGATGSGKSVCINTIIMSILYKAHPDEVKLIMIDPKVVELSVYNGIPHLLLPVVTDPKKAASALHWGVAEMTERYNKFAEAGVRDLKGYNQKAEELQKRGGDGLMQKMPQIVIIVDELADLMMVAPGEVEESICRLAQLARAAGIHLIIATQRPSVDVITGLIKANMPSRVAFAVSSGVDSRTILDMVGAEKLLGKGDMLFYPQGYTKPARIQGAFISDEEVQDVVDFLKDQNVISSYSPDIEKEIKEAGSISGGAQSGGDSEYDEYFAEAGRFIIEKDKASIGMLQRVFKIGFNRAARIMDQLCEAGVVGEEEGTKPRKVLMSPEQFEQFVEESVG